MFNRLPFNMSLRLSGVLARRFLHTSPLLRSSNQACASILQLRHTDICAEPPNRGLVIGIYADPDDMTDTGYLTASGWRYNVTKTEGRLLEVLKLSGPVPKPAEARLLFCVEPAKVPYYTCVAVVGLGKECAGYNSYEVMDERKEIIRRAVAVAIRKMSMLGTDHIDVETCGHAESAAEGAALAAWRYQELKDSKLRLKIPNIDMYTHKDEICDLDGWRIGLQKAAAQNFCREMQEAPPNVLTPTTFAEKAIQELCRSGVNVEVKTEGWAESQQMNAFLAVGRASCEAPIFLELTYYGAKSDERPIVLVGQGVTYDAGGLCLKEMDELKIMRADMTGAAVVVAACKAISALRLPINLRALVPLCENVLGCNSFRPGDVVKCRNGKSIEVQTTDQEDVLVLADALLYAQNFCPKFIVDVGTTASSLRNALDEAACAVFTNSNILWDQIKNASVHTGDRVWRMPLWRSYADYVTQSSSASDIQNEGSGTEGKPCRAAAFLQQFVPCGQWMHIDCSNVVYTRGDDFEYLRPGMSGRPTRTLIEFLAQTVCKDVHPKQETV